MGLKNISADVNIPMICDMSLRYTPSDDRKKVRAIINNENGIKSTGRRKMVN